MRIYAMIQENNLLSNKCTYIDKSISFYFIILLQIFKYVRLNKIRYKIL